MIIIPAIDLKGGKVVRLIKGDFSAQLDYGDDPVAVAMRWAQAGAQRLHVVDLDGALTGTPRHLEIIGKIAKTAGIPVQTGGGIRTAVALERCFAAGVAQAILGTKACVDEAFVTKAIKNHGDKIAAAVDVKDGRVAVEGWVRKEFMKPEPLIGRLLSQGIKTIIYTDASRDGTMSGPGIEGLKSVLDKAAGKASFIASGGVSSLEDLLKVKELEPLGVTGVIVGRALYDGKIDLGEAIKLCSQKGSSPASTSKTAGSSKESGS